MINIDISEKNRQIVVEILGILLADEYILYTKTLKFHWNVEGKHFGALHEFFKDHYEALLTIVDDVAERIRALGHLSPATLSEFLKLTTLSEEPGKNPDDLGMLRALLNDHEAIIREIRKVVERMIELGDTGTNNFLADLMEKHEKMAWMLRAHLAR